jgi:hypothetical protein
MQIRDVRPQPFVFQLRCDRCGAEAQHNVDNGFNDFVSVGFDAGWGSSLGDGNRIDLDLCHGCLKETLGPWLRVSKSSANQPASNYEDTFGAEQTRR